MAEKSLTEGGDRVVNNSSTRSESTKNKLSGKYYKNTDQTQYVDSVRLFSPNTNRI